MTRYKKDAKEFDVSLTKSKNRDGSESIICRIPRAVIESLGSPNSLLFRLGRSRVSVEAGTK